MSARWLALVALLLLLTPLYVISGVSNVSLYSVTLEVAGESKSFTIPESKKSVEMKWGLQLNCEGKEVRLKGVKVRVTVSHEGEAKRYAEAESVSCCGESARLKGCRVVGKESLGQGTYRFTLSCGLDRELKTAVKDNKVVTVSCCGKSVRVRFVLGNSGTSCDKTTTTMPETPTTTLPVSISEDGLSFVVASPWAGTLTIKFDGREYTQKVSKGKTNVLIPPYICLVRPQKVTFTLGSLSKELETSEWLDNFCRQVKEVRVKDKEVFSHEPFTLAVIRGDKQIYAADAEQRGGKYVAKVPASACLPNAELKAYFNEKNLKLKLIPDCEKLKEEYLTYMLSNKDNKITVSWLGPDQVTVSLISNNEVREEQVKGNEPITFNITEDMCPLVKLRVSIGGEELWTRNVDISRTEVCSGKPGPGPKPSPNKVTTVTVTTTVHTGNDEIPVIITVINVIVAASTLLALIYLLRRTKLP